MKKLSFIIIAFLLSVSSLFAQKVGKGEAPRPTEFYSCPKHSEITSHDPGKCNRCGTELALTSKEKRAATVAKSYTCPAHMEVVSHDPGKCPKCGKKLNLSPKEQAKAQALKVYTCPMHPDVSLDKNGNCPECEKALAEKKK